MSSVILYNVFRDELCMIHIIRCRYEQLVYVLQVPGDELEDSEVLKGVMLNKDVTHSKMARRIENPRVVLLDCGLEYKKAESQVGEGVYTLVPVL